MKFAEETRGDNKVVYCATQNIFFRFSCNQCLALYTKNPPDTTNKYVDTPATIIFAYLSWNLFIGTYVVVINFSFLA